MTPHPHDPISPSRRRRGEPRALVAVAFGAALAAHALPAAAQGGDPAAGRKKARPCAACHGPTGISQTPDAPHLAGQPEVYFIDQMKAYRSRKRIHPQMNVVAKPLTDVDIDDLAAWYASIKVSAEPSPTAPQEGGGGSRKNGSPPSGSTASVRGTCPPSRARRSAPDHVRSAWVLRLTRGPSSREALDGGAAGRHGQKTMSLLARSSRHTCAGYAGIVFVPWRSG